MLGTNSGKAPIFVVGAPRSGTTLVSTILGRHEDVFAPGETHFFEDVWSRRKELGTLADDAGLNLAATRLLTIFERFNFSESQNIVNSAITKEALVCRTRELGGGYDALYWAFMSMLSETADKTRFCDDTPKHLYYLHDIFELFPGAVVIGCIRDPRDFLCSYKNYWKKSTESARVKALYHPVITSLLWRSSSNLLLEHKNQRRAEQILLVKYETLVKNPQEQVGRICDFAQLDYSDELILIETHNSSFEQSAPGIFTTSVGRWRECLQAEEVWWAQTIGKKCMSAVDYSAETVRPSKISLSLAIITAPIALIKALRANAQKRGPTLSYILRRLLSLLKK